MSFPRLVPSGDAALLVELGDAINPIVNRRVHALAAQVQALKLPGLAEAVPGYCTLLVHYDPAQLDFATVRDMIARLAAAIESAPAPQTRRVEIPVVYDGPDLAFVAQHNGLTAEEVVRLHTAGEYRVYMMGFMPGFAYLGEVDARLAVPRLETPRLRVPAGSVGIAGRQTGIYPLESPGGWRLVGRTPLVMFDLARTPPFLLSPGDVVTFVRLSADE